jgi:hypothetical protein
MARKKIFNGTFFASEKINSKQFPLFWKGTVMAQDCELLNTCGFFKKHGATKELACRGFVQQYCKGPKQNACKRKEYRRQNGAPPSDDMMPSGQMIA